MKIDATGEPRLVVVGLDSEGRSVVVSDAPAGMRAERPNGNVVHDLWRQPRLPARPTDDGTSHAPPGALPEAGAIVRVLTMPPNATGERPPLDLHTTAALIVLTVITGTAVVAVERGDIVLEPGATAVIAGTVHDIGNLSAVTAQVVFTVFPLVDD